MQPNHALDGAIAHALAAEAHEHAMACAPARRVALAAHAWALTDAALQEWPEDGTHAGWTLEGPSPHAAAIAMHDRASERLGDSIDDATERFHDLGHRLAGCGLPI